MLKSANLFRWCFFLHLCFLWLIIWIFFYNFIKNRLRSDWFCRLLKNRFEWELIAHRLLLFRHHHRSYSILLLLNSSLHNFSEISRCPGHGFRDTDFTFFLDLLYWCLILVHESFLVLSQLCLKIIIIILLLNNLSWRIS